MTDHLLPVVNLEQREVVAVVVQWAEVYQTHGISEFVSRLLTKSGYSPVPSSEWSIDRFCRSSLPDFVQWDTITMPHKDGLIRYVHSGHDYIVIEPFSVPKPVECVTGYRCVVYGYGVELVEFPLAQDPSFDVSDQSVDRSI